MKTSFRSAAHQALSRAKAEIESGSHERLRYAALELRLCIEALTYDRAQAFATEIPPEQYDTWQPRKLLQVLLDIEPTADQSYTLSYGQESAFGQRAEEMRVFGSETVFNLRAIKKHYDALGSFLHMPTLKQVQEDGDSDFSKLKSRCALIVASLDAALLSTVYNATFARFTQLNCLECGEIVRKRFPVGKEVVDVECFECHAGYRLTSPEPGKVHWEPMQQIIACQTKSCGHEFAIWNHEIKPGTHWKCVKCEQRFRIGFAVLPDEATPSAT